MDGRIVAVVVVGSVGILVSIAAFFAVCCVRNPFKQHKWYAAGAFGAASVAAAVAAGFAGDALKHIVDILTSPTELLDAARAIANCGDFLADLEQEIDDYGTVSGADAQVGADAMVACIVIFAVLPLVCGGISAAIDFDVGVAISLLFGGVAIEILASLAISSDWGCSYRDDLTDELSWLFETDSATQLPPYLSETLFNSLNTCSNNHADETITKWLNPGPLASSYDDVTASLCDGLVPSAYVATSLTVLIVMAYLAAVILNLDNAYSKVPNGKNAGGLFL